MNQFAELLTKHYKENPNNVVLRSKNYREGISFKTLYELSGRVYAYLKEKNIGTEDFVLILLPRDINVQICMSGILRAGAAFTVVENSYPKERIDFIIKDVNPKLILNHEVFNEMMLYEPLDGFEDVSLHDACYAVYTSGSTGTPKGVLQEYGQIDKYLDSQYDLTKAAREPSKFCCGIICPLIFTAHYFIFFSAVYLGASIYIVDYDIVKNFKVFGDYLEKENINMVFMTPSLLKAFRTIPKSLKLVLIGGENPNSIYFRDLKVGNIYSSSEAGFDIACFDIDKKREKIPAGKNLSGETIYILDDDNKPTNVGEICFKNEYFRGYINDEDKTKSVFVNGLFHSGDVGYLNEEGYLYVCGRKDDMIKINGNRIEPTEIEQTLKEILGLNYVVVKGFDENDHSFIVAYFLEKELANLGLMKDGKLILNFDELQKKLLDKIPYYMVPTYFVTLNEFPMNTSGKIDKKSLKSPVFLHSFNNVQEATNDTEKYLCELFKKVLKIDKVGVDDDFYFIGGDSLKSMELMSECELKFLTINDLFEYRTPRKISEYYLKHFNSVDDIEKRNQEALSKPQKVMIEVIDFLDINFRAPKSTMMNLPLLLKIDNRVDINKLKKAVDKVFKHHPVFSSVFFFDEDTEIKQKYMPSLFQETKIVEVNENEFNEIKNNLVKCFKHVCNSLLYRKTIYKVNDDLYLFLDIHHLIADGLSINLVISQINKCYFDSNYVLPTDYYYLTLSNYKIEQDEFNKPNNEVRRYYSDLSKDFIGNKKFFPVYYPDKRKLDFTRKDLIQNLKLDKKLIYKYAKENNISENIFFICVALICNAIRNKSPKVMINFIHNGRSNNLLASSCGLLFHTHPVFADFTKYETIKDFYLDISNQVDFGIRSGDFNCSNYINNDISLGIYFLYQKDIYNFKKFDIVENLIQLPNKDAAIDSLLEISLVDNSSDEDLILKLGYANGFYKSKTIKNLFDKYEKVIKSLLELDTNAKIKEVLKK